MWVSTYKYISYLLVIISLYIFIYIYIYNSKGSCSFYLIIFQNTL